MFNCWDQNRYSNRTWAIGTQIILFFFLFYHQLIYAIFYFLVSLSLVTLILLQWIYLCQYNINLKSYMIRLNLKNDINLCIYSK